MRTILVTGGAGFIGSAFVRYLGQHRKDSRVIVLDALTYAGNLDNLPYGITESQDFEFWRGDVNDLDLVGDLVSRSDVVVHFAAETHVARSLYNNRVFFETDVLGTQSVANAVLRRGDRVERLIHISSSEVYGTAAYEPMDECHPLNPTSPYAAAKAGADRLVYAYMRTYDLPALILRPFNTYGPYQHLEKAIPRFITSALRNERLAVHGTGAACRDWIYVDDVARAVDAAVQAPLHQVKGQVINVGTGRSVSILRVARLVLELLGKPRALVEFVEDRLGQVGKHISSTARAQELLGLGATVSLEEGLERTISWYAENREWWQRLLTFRKVPVRLASGKVVWY